MFIAYIVVAVLISLLLVVSARSKLVKEADVTATMTRLDVPLSWFAPLAVLEIAGAVGLLAGIAFRPLGIAAGIGVVLYFIGAVIAHARANDIKGAPMAGVLVVASGASVALGVLSF
ncbi:DoxX family protein [Actinokineospora sp. G85]|uniref:DoxX family protein n=1 Tax=Actinokineospora sp. G85 TaxID=3406626 RepID=UPI003C71FEC9